MSGPVARTTGDSGVASGMDLDDARLERDAQVRAKASGHRRGEALAIDRERAAGGHARLVRAREDERPGAPQLLLEEADGVGERGAAHRVRADELAERVGRLRGRPRQRLLLDEAHVDAPLGELPRGLAPGETRADDGDGMAMARALAWAPGGPSTSPSPPASSCPSRTPISPRCSPPCAPPGSRPRRSAGTTRSTSAVRRGTPHHPAFDLELLGAAGRVPRVGRPRGCAHDALNGRETVRWNTHKSYLLDLQARGLPVVPTHLVRRGDTTRLGDISARARLGGGRRQARGLRRIARDDPRRHAARSTAARRTCGRSRRARTCSCSRTCRRSRGTASARSCGSTASRPTRSASRRASSATPSRVSAAVPIAADEADARAPRRRRCQRGRRAAPLRTHRRRARRARRRRVLMELELVEPSLFFAQAPAALDRYVAAVKRRLAR